jgi:hypothetical protein
MYDSACLHAVFILNVLRIMCNFCCSLFFLAKRLVEGDSWLKDRGTPIGDIKQYLFSHGLTTTGNKVMLGCMCVYVCVCVAMSVFNT